jgi:hypothetical protein
MNLVLTNSKSLMEDIALAETKGYIEDFIFKEGRLFGRTNKKAYASEDCILFKHFVQEAWSNPSDQSIIFLIECTDGTKGSLSSAYGIYADSKLIDFCMSLKRSFPIKQN